MAREGPENSDSTGEPVPIAGKKFTAHRVAGRINASRLIHLPAGRSARRWSHAASVFTRSSWLYRRGHSPTANSRAECAALSALADNVRPATPDDGPDRRTECNSRWVKPFLDLFDHPAVLPALVELIGPKPRLDRDYRLFMRAGGRRASLRAERFLSETDH